MKRNYTAIHYIQNQLKGFNPKFIDCVTRCFNLIEQHQEPDGCLSNSIALYICAKEYGYNPVLCYGLCELDGIEFYHSWIEIDGIVIDLSIYGNVNYSPFAMWENNLEVPYIGTYQDSAVQYGKFKFDDDWSYSLIAQVEGWSFEKYMNGLPQNAMWKVVCKILDRTTTPNLVEHLKTHIKGRVIERIPQKTKEELELEKIPQMTKAELEQNLQLSAEIKRDCPEGQDVVCVTLPWLDEANDVIEVYIIRNKDGDIEFSFD